MTITINGYTYRNTVAISGGVSMIGVSAEHRAGAGVAGGDEVKFDIELDTAPRVVTLPDDFATALEAEPDARRTFDGLSYGNKSWHVLQVTGREDRRNAKPADREVDRGAPGRPHPLIPLAAPESRSPGPIPPWSAPNSRPHQLATLSPGDS